MVDWTTGKPETRVLPGASQNTSTTLFGRQTHQVNLSVRLLLRISPSRRHRDEADGLEGAGAESEK